ncbi:hypothetical protein ACJX0J_032241, partial [Zea mays]
FILGDDWAFHFFSLEEESSLLIFILYLNFIFFYKILNLIILINIITIIFVALKIDMHAMAALVIYKNLIKKGGKSKREGRGNQKGKGYTVGGGGGYIGKHILLATSLIFCNLIEAVTGTTSKDVDYLIRYSTPNNFKKKRSFRHRLIGV